MSVQVKRKSSKIDFTEGPLSVKILKFVIPLLLSGLLQNFYHIADQIVVGQFSGDELALAAVGSAGAFSSLVVNLLLSISAGTAVTVAEAFGAKDKEAISKSVHTSVTFAFVGGLIFMIIGLLVSRPALILMNTKEELLSRAVIYMRIVCVGIPATATYNFASSALRSVGDSKTSLYLLSASGALNVILNLVFVLCFGMASDGVALATVITQYLGAGGVITVLALRKSEAYALKMRKLGIDKKTLARILRIGIPTTIQSLVFSASNAIVATAANSFSTIEVTARTISNSIANFMNTACAGFTHASVTSAAQNYGAKKYKRINRSILICVLQSVLIVIPMLVVIFVFGNPIIGGFVDSADPNREAIIDVCKQILLYGYSLYFFVGIMNSLTGTLRGIGYSMVSMIVYVGSVCGVRLLWIYTAFMTEPLHTIQGLHLLYPISWIVSSISLAVAYVFAYKRVIKKHDAMALGEVSSVK